MTRTLQSLLDERASELPGRERERAVLLGLADGERPLFAAVHGIAGVGKSALARAFARDARERGVRVLEVDGRAIEPTESGFLDGLGRLLDRKLPSPRDAAAALEGLPGRTILVLDPYERLRLLDTWLRLRLVPELPAGVRILLADRNPPTAWTREFGDALLTLRLENLAPDAARRVLERSGVKDDALAAGVNRIARGHPLSLQLAAGALAARPELARAEVAVTPMLEELAELYLSSLDASTRRALDAASVVRRATLSLLDAMVPDDPPAEAFEALRRLPFVDVGPEGLVIHDTVRGVTAALLRAGNPVLHRRYRADAWRQLRRELREAGSAQLWRYTADMLYLVEHPIVHDAFFPTGSEDFAVEPARSTDGPALETITREHQPAALPTLRAFWDGAPDAFRVARGADGAVAAWALVFEPETVSTALLSADPVTRAWREHRRREPVPRGQRVLYIRDGLARNAAARAALWLDLKRDYLEMRPALRRVYVATTDPEAVLPALEPLGFAPLGLEPIPVEGLTVTTLLNDMGPASVDGWLSDVVGRELQAAEEGVLDAARRELVLDGRRIELTRLEFDVLRYLQEHEGEAVERDRLLRDVWGYDWTGGSNVIEVVVSALRRKLGDRADALETVRGVGYRLRPLA